MREIDEVTFTSILLEFIQDKEKFIQRLDAEKPTNEELLERFLAEREKAESMAEYYQDHGEEIAAQQEADIEQATFEHEQMIKNAE